MITRAKIGEYIWAGGDLEGYSRSGRRSDISDKDWALIGEMLSAITIIRRGLAADYFIREQKARVAELFDSEDTFNLLVDYEAKGEQDSAANPAIAALLKSMRPADRVA